MAGTGLPLLAGILAPVAQTIGLFIWQDRWKGSALGLNAFKGCTAALFHGAVALATTTSFKSAYQSRVVGYMLLSSLLGIIIADTWWLMALARLGARRMIAIDAIKPFLAIGFGVSVLGDRVSALGYAGVLVTSCGIFLVNYSKGASSGETDTNRVGLELEKQNATVESPIILDDGLGSQPASPSPQGDATTSTASRRSSFDLVAYMYAVGNVVLDVWAAVITVSWHRDLSSADVNLLRFGFAGAVCTVAVALREAALDQFAAQTRARSDASAAAYATAIAAAPKEGEVVVRESHGIPPPESGAAATGRIDSNGVAETTSNEAAVCATSRAGGSSGSSSDDAVAVAEARAAVAMTGADWRAVGVGVVFVTVLCPLASTWCLFHLPLAVALTLGSTAPLWSLPVARCHGEDLTQRAVGGALLATAGVVMLAFN